MGSAHLRTVPELGCINPRSWKALTDRSSLGFGCFIQYIPSPQRALFRIYTPAKRGAEGLQTKRARWFGGHPMGSAHPRTARALKKEID